MFAYIIIDRVLHIEKRIVWTFISPEKRHYAYEREFYILTIDRTLRIGKKTLCTSIS